LNAIPENLQILGTNGWLIVRALGGWKDNKLLATLSARGMRPRRLAQSHISPRICTQAQTKVSARDRWPSAQSPTQLMASRPNEKLDFDWRRVGLKLPPHYRFYAKTWETILFAKITKVPLLLISFSQAHFKSGFFTILFWVIWFDIFYKCQSQLLFFLLIAFDTSKLNKIFHDWGLRSTKYMLGIIFC
jgi:hypothetical protein